MPSLHPDPPRIPPHLFSEQEVLAALRTLPPEAHVFVRLRLLDAETNRDRELDFLVIHPELGLVIIEVKGRGVEPCGDHWIRKDSQGQKQVLEESPGEQLLAQQYALLRFLQEAGLGFVPQITRVLALPALPLKPGQALGPDLPSCRILTREKLQRPFLALREAVAGGTPWETWRKSPEARHHEVWPEPMRKLLDLMVPQLAAPPTLAQVLEAEGRLQDLTARTLMDHLAMNFSRGRFHVQGGPGSGKSLLARQVARLWASEGRHVLVLAFNKALTYATQNALDDLLCADRALVSTYHDLAVNLLREAGQLPPCEDQARFFNEQVPKGLNDLITHGKCRSTGRWNALVVDEAQDLDPSWVRPIRLLLVDDDPVLLETLTDLLQNEGFRVTSAASGEEAERLLASTRPSFDLVLTDLVMPGKSGMDVLSKALEVNPTCTVLVLTGFGSVREATEAMDRGAYGMVTKPLNLDQFRNILRRLMERIALIHERDELRIRVKDLQARVDALETTKGRMEMLARRITPPAESGPESLSDLERLAGLKDRGLLTEEQFEAAKRTLLSRWLP